MMGVLPPAVCPLPAPVASSAFVPPASTPAGQAALERLRAWPGEHRVAVGLSGGVDSSLTAALLVEAGWQVEGLTLWLMSGKGACCAEGLVDAAGICEQLGVPHHVVDFREHFQAQIVNFLVQGYQAGVTPLPCSRCNREVKFGPMLQWAESERSIGRLATGHYARVRHGASSDNGRHQLLRGLDGQKDQSYFLHAVAAQDLLDFRPSAPITEAGVRTAFEAAYKALFARTPPGAAIQFVASTLTSESKAEPPSSMTTSRHVFVAKIASYTSKRRSKRRRPYQWSWAPVKQDDRPREANFPTST